MNSDHELLELAAKAAGIEIVGLVDKMICQPDHRTGGFIIRNERGGDSCWNPLTDDGDALRLLAALPSLWSLGLKFGSPSIVMDVAWGFKGIKVTKFNGQNTDRAEVIRRAIVEAAAEMAKATGEK